MFDKKLNNYDLFIFDCDGVIFKSNYIKLKCFLKSIQNDEKKNKELFKEYLIKNVGLDRKKKFKFYIEYIRKEKLKISDINKLITKYIYYSQKLVKKSPFMPGIKKFLTEIKKNEKKIVLLTNADQDETKRILKYRKIDKLFDDILGRPKSKIININSFLNKNKYKKIIFFGDALNDYKIAKKLDFDFIYIQENSFDKSNFDKLKNLKATKNFLNLIK